jgi:hypothetical protein
MAVLVLHTQATTADISHLFQAMAITHNQVQARVFSVLGQWKYGITILATVVVATLVLSVSDLPLDKLIML